MPERSRLESFNVYLGRPATVTYRDLATKTQHRLRLDPRSDVAVPQRSYVAQWFDDLHSLSISQALWLERVGGFACVLLCLSLLTLDPLLRDRRGPGYEDARRD